MKLPISKISELTGIHRDTVSKRLADLVRIPMGAPHSRIRLTQQSERTGIENKWSALTGRVVALKAEKDGDLHIVLRQATSRGSLLLKYQQNRSGVQFVKRFSAGRGLDFLFTLALLRS
jgi:hypothetical protein